ncbi:MAG TPA: DUF72 domain-containing protein [Pseudobacter sp.]|nr:DUF72 domain-containing protein [Pseudobacter sp.]
MHFGKVPENEVSSIDFSLRPDPPGNALVLPGKPVPHPRLYVGCATRGPKQWINKIYPKGTKEVDYLDEYVKHFNSIEFNATHYQIYGEDIIGRWAAKAEGRDFMFCPKVPQLISHYSGFNNVDEPTDSFLRGILAFGEHLGPIFLQLSEKHSPANQQKLFSYLRSLPTDLTFFLEVRHPDWLVDGPVKDHLFGTLREMKIGAVITDAAGRRDCAHMELTIPKAFIRYVGHAMGPTDPVRMNRWADRLKQWLDKGLEEIWFFMHTPDEIMAPEMVEYFAGRMEAVCGLHIPRPQFIQPAPDPGSTQMSMF